LGIAAAALIILAVGGAIGYYLGRLQQSASSARLEEVESEFDTYRKDVTEHFSKTAEQFQAIGLQYRELYNHLAEGSAALCQLDKLDAEPPFPLVTDARSETVESPADTGQDESSLEAAAEPVADTPAEEPMDETPEETTAELSSTEPEAGAAPDADERPEPTGSDESVKSAADASVDTNTKPDNVVELVRPAGSEPAGVKPAGDGAPDSDERSYH
ncbi:MAG: DUF1043 family protein, partial [Woeseiaceae bacterium]|nr:DUF1043 family protein [Woeseiaceae bacterium]